jgi:RNA polymerase sigma-70 factor (ECF subfamily)
MSADPLSPDRLPEDQHLLIEMRPALLRFFRRKTGSAVDAEDMTQDVLVSALRHSNWTSPEQAGGYIFRTAINRLHDSRRRRYAQGIQVPYEEKDLAGGSQNPPERVLIAQEELTAIDRALEDLNVRTRTVLMLIKLEGMKATTVAEMLGISVRAVNKHVQKAIAHLAKLQLGEDLP